MNQSSLYIGIDLGTSGVRACAINQQEELLHTCTTALPAPLRKGSCVTQDASLWWQATKRVLTELFNQLDASQIKAISVNGTSGTVLLCDEQGTPLSPALMYNDASSTQQAKQISVIAPSNSAAHGASSGLAKLLQLQQSYTHASHLLHQADWIVGKLCGRFNISDENNALKTGYDPLTSSWPQWLDDLAVKRSLLPEVVPPGTLISAISKGLFNDMNPDCKIISGTTDSIAAFIATGASKPGDAVTSLGSTLVLKVLCEQPVSAAEFGIYSHRLGNYWLAGGASNSGGAVLAHYFEPVKLQQLSHQLTPEKPTGLNYYPLLQKGERFPVNDEELPPRLEPAADSDVIFFQAMLEGISQIEADGYKKLQQLGAPYPNQVETAGGGSSNTAWSKIRQQALNVPVLQAKNSEACYGSALLAKRGFAHT